MHCTEKRYRNIKLGNEYILVKELNYLKTNIVIDIEWFLYGYDEASPAIQTMIPGLPPLTPQQQAKLLKLLSDNN